jgi:alkylation response protein AidB-like acyl-CoA dehydrogenase
MTTAREMPSVPRPTAPDEQLRATWRRYLWGERPTGRVHEYVFEAPPAGGVRDRKVPSPPQGTGQRCIVMAEMGRALLPGPFFASSVLAFDLIAGAAAEPARSRLLAQIAEGTGSLVGVLPDRFAADAPVALETATGYVLNAQDLCALDAGSATRLVIIARQSDGDLGLYTVAASAPGLTLASRDSVDPTRRLFDLTADAVPLSRIDDGEGTAEAIDLALDRATVALAAEMVGSAELCVELAVAWVRHRRQFGVPVGTFQAVKHRCADIAVDVDAAREAVRLAAEVLDGGEPGHVPATASAAKLAAGDALLAASEAAIQLHGARGFTTEYLPEAYYKRALINASVLGTAAEHRDRLASLFDL